VTRKTSAAAFCAVLVARIESGKFGSARMMDTEGLCQRDYIKGLMIAPHFFVTMATGR
jgi:hypothetical protein